MGILPGRRPANWGSWRPSWDCDAAQCCAWVGCAPAISVRVPAGFEHMATEGSCRSLGMTPDMFGCSALAGQAASCTRLCPASAAGQVEVEVTSRACC